MGSAEHSHSCVVASGVRVLILEAKLAYQLLETDLIVQTLTLQQIPVAVVRRKALGIRLVDQGSKTVKFEADFVAESWQVHVQRMAEHDNWQFPSCRCEGSMGQANIHSSMSRVSRFVKKRVRP